MIGTVLAANTGGQLGSMFVFFLIALVIVSPFAYPRIRSVLRERRTALGGTEPETTGGPDPAPPRPSADLAHVVDAIATAADELGREPGGTRIIDVPIDPLVEGRPSNTVVVDALLNDAVRRSGLRSVWIAGNRPGRQLLVSTDDA